MTHSREIPSNAAADSPGLLIHPIGYLRTGSVQKFEAPPQPGNEGAAQAQGVVELLPGRNYEIALRDLDGFSRIWLVWWFHRNRNWRPTTLPPRGRSGRKGTFATRSPYRPNPLALSCVRLLRVEQNQLLVGGHDLLDGTPILDIKPYLPQFDSFPEAESGWYGEMERELQANPAFSLRYSPQAQEFLASQAPGSLAEKIQAVLSVDPLPHRTRRIVDYDGGYRLACGRWRVYYRVHEKLVFIEEIESKNP